MKEKSTGKSLGLESSPGGDQTGFKMWFMPAQKHWLEGLCNVSLVVKISVLIPDSDFGDGPVGV